MVEKIWVCLKCNYVPQNIREQSRTCPKCGEPCQMKDFVKAEDFKAILEDYEREGRVLKPVKDNEKE